MKRNKRYFRDANLKKKGRTFNNTPCRRWQNLASCCETDSDTT